MRRCGKGRGSCPRPVRRAILRRMDNSAFRRQLRQFRILTVAGYVLLALDVVGMAIAQRAFPQSVANVPTLLPISLVGIVLALAVAMPFVWAAYDKTACPHCGKRIDEGHFLWHGIRCNGPTRRYWKLFFGKPLRCPHCKAEVIGDPA